MIMNWIQRKFPHNWAKREKLFKKKGQAKVLAQLMFILKTIRVKSKLKSFLFQILNNSKKLKLKKKNKIPSVKITATHIAKIISKSTIKAQNI